MNTIKIISGTAHPDLAEGISHVLDVPLTKATVGAFPNGETKVKIEENIRGNDVFLIQPTCPNTNQNLMELLITVDAAKRASASRITAVIPFYGYARQDRKDQPRVPITAKLVANLLVAAGVNRILTVDLHAQQIQGFFDIPVDHLSALPVIYRHLLKHPIPNLAVASPDVGGVKNASVYAKQLKASLVIICKERIDDITTKAQEPIGDVKGKNILLVDDMTESAGTLVNAAAMLKDHGALRVVAAVSHTILNEHATKRLQNCALDEIITTNTTPVVKSMSAVPITVLDMSDLLGKAIRRIHTDQSVAELFEV